MPFCKENKAICVTGSTFDIARQRCEQAIRDSFLNLFKQCKPIWRKRRRELTNTVKFVNGEDRIKIFNEDTGEIVPV